MFLPPRRPWFIGRTIIVIMYSTLLMLLLSATICLGDTADIPPSSCPSGWITHEASCYTFVSHRPSSWHDSSNICNGSYNGAHLVSVNTPREEAFLVEWLRENDLRRKAWWTSGQLINDRWEWSGDGSPITYYAHGARLVNAISVNARIAYAWRSDEFVWISTNSNTLLSSICELPKSKIFTYYSDQPGLDYGLIGAEALRHTRGPRIVEEPSDVITYANGPRHSIALPCKADAYPSPTYKWIKASSGQEISTTSDSNYVLIDGTLIIRNVSAKDFGAYFCEATNGVGVIRSRTASFISSYVKEFPKSRLDVYGIEGVGKSIPCEPPSHFPQSLNFAWMYETVKNFLHESNRIFMSSDGTLHFSHLTSADQKQYACSVVIPEMHTGYYGPFFSLKVDPPSSSQGLPGGGSLAAASQSASKPIMADGFLQIYPNEPRLGEAAWIECFAYGRPAPIYRWTRVDRPLNSHVLVRNFGRRIYFPQLFMNDTGTYRCIAENRDGSASKDINLVLQITPKLITPLVDRVIETGGSASFLCDVFGVPRVEYEWFHNGKPLNPLLMPDEDQGRISVDGNRLTIDSVHFRDSGVYQCVASNSLGRTSGSAELIVRNIAPSFAKQRPDRIVYAVAGASARLPCRAEALPRRSGGSTASTWRHDNFQLTPGGGSGMRQLTGGDLIIDSVNFSHNGRYTCTVENDLGLDSTSMMLTILPQLTVDLRSKSSPNGSETIDCSVNWESDKYMDVARRWTFNCHEIDSLSQFGGMINDSLVSSVALSNSPRVTIPSDRFFDGLLMCRADTVAGHASASIDIRRKRPPMTPIKATVYNATANGIRMSWELPSAASNSESDDRWPVTFRVEARLEGTRTWRHVQVVHTTDAISTNHYLITSANVLLPNARYQFRVLAQNRLGRSEPSRPTDFLRTRPGPPAKAPTNLRTSVLVSGEILVQWKPLQEADWGAESVGYFLEWQYANSSSDLVKSSVTLRRTDADRYVIRREPTTADDIGAICTRHEIHLSAFNELGRGPVIGTGAESHVLAAPYSQLANLTIRTINSSAVSINWTRLVATGDQPCQKWTGIKLYYWLQDDKRPIASYSPSKSFPFVKFVSLNRSEMILADLLSSTTYTFQLVLFNINGDGPRSIELMATTHPSGPKASPGSISVTDDLIDGRMVAVVRWDEIDFKDSRLDGYKIHLYKSPWAIPYVMEVEARNNAIDWQPVVELDGLRAFQEYKLYISAFTEGGDGPLSDPVVFYLGSQSSSWWLRSSSTVVRFCLAVLLVIHFGR